MGEQLRVEGLRIEYPGFVLEADFSIHAHERVALSGASGMGKTTLLRWMAGLEPAQAGRLWLGSHELTAAPPERRGFGVVFQESALFGSLTVLQNVGFGLKVRGVPTAEREKRAVEILTRFGLESKASRRAAGLSGGEKQRVALARACVWGPRALLLDEPLSALDAALRTEVRESLRSFHAQLAAPMLLVTHDEKDEQALATRVLKIVSDPSSPHLRRVVNAS